MKFSTTDRYVAFALGAIWCSAGIVLLVFAWRSGRWLLAPLSLFGFWYAAVWLKVARLRRRLDWHECLQPWKAIK